MIQQKMIAKLGQGTIRHRSDGQCRHPEALQGGDQAQEVFSLPAIAEQQAEVPLLAEAEVPVQGLVGIKKADGIPVELKVPANLRQMGTFLPTPVKTSFLLPRIVPSINLMALMKASSSLSEVNWMAARSISRHFRALAMISCEESVIV
jgi:hypothetical protein